MTNLTHAIALSLLLTGAPVATFAHAQTSELKEKPAGELFEPAAENEPSGEQTLQPGAESGDTQSPLVNDETADEAQTDTPKPIEGQITTQSVDTVLVNDLIGATVFSTADEAIGKVNDLIIKPEGTVEGVVIGVGGFIGIGEKDVAVGMKQLSVFANSTDDLVWLVLDATKDDLESAPGFQKAAATR